MPSCAPPWTRPKCRASSEHIKGEDVHERLTEALELDPAGTDRMSVQIEDEELANASSLPELAKLLSAA